MVLFDGRQAWFHSMSTDTQVVTLYDWIEALVRAGEFLPPPAALAAIGLPVQPGKSGPNVSSQFSGWVSCYTP
jgi:hypothetical protein